MDIRYLASYGYQLWPCDVTTSGIGGYGIIEVEPGFQMAAAPVIYGYWDSVSHKHIHDGTTLATVYNYLVLQIEDVYGVPANTMIEVFNTLVGGNSIYWNFVPGVTNPLSPHNFYLSYYDSGADSQEVTGFFIKSIHPTTFSLVWGERP
jgi:hypothetical protein